MGALSAFHRYQYPRPLGLLCHRTLPLIDDPIKCEGELKSDPYPLLRYSKLGTLPERISIPVSDRY